MLLLWFYKSLSEEQLKRYIEYILNEIYKKLSLSGFNTKQLFYFQTLLSFVLFCVRPLFFSSENTPIQNLWFKAESSKFKFC